jgi:hypothetical protein
LLIFLNFFFGKFFAAIIAYYDVNKGQLFISAVDTVILSVLMVVFVICETQKNDDFFEEPKNQL